MLTGSFPPRTRLQQGLVAIAAFGLVAVVFFMIARVLPGVDYTYTFRPTARAWLHSETRLYSADDAASGFYNTPWLLVFIIPFAVVPFEVGQALWNTIALVGIVVSIHLWRDERKVPGYLVVMAILNAHTLDMLIRVQVDSLVLLAVVLGWWAVRQRRPLWLSASFFILSTKTLNVALVGLLYLLALRRWPRRNQLLAVSLPLAAFFLSFFFISLDWPLRFLRHSSKHGEIENHKYIEVTLWKGAAQLGLPVLPFVVIAILAVVAFLYWSVQEGTATRWLVGVALATNLVFTNYANGNHYVTLIPVFIYVAWHNPRLALLAYLTTWTPFLRIFLGNEFSWVDIGYAVILLVGAWYYGLQESSAIAAEAAPVAATPVAS